MGLGETLKYLVYLLHFLFPLQNQLKETKVCFDSHSIMKLMTVAHIVSTLREQRVVNTCAQLPFCFLFSPAILVIEFCLPWLLWVCPSQSMQPRNPFIDMPSGLSPRGFQILSN